MKKYKKGEISRFAA